MNYPKKILEQREAIRTNRTENCPLENAKLFKKRNRGSHEYYSDTLKNLIIVRWRDNNVVTIGSNMHGVFPIVKAKR